MLSICSGNSISSLDEIDQGVDVTFEHGPPQTFDLVIGADGLHSITRRLAFGEECQFLHFWAGTLRCLRGRIISISTSRCWAAVTWVAQRLSTRFVRPARRG